MVFCQFDISKECAYHSTSDVDCVLCVLKEAKKIHPHINGDPLALHARYSKGWEDAINYIASRMNLNL